VYCEYQNVKVLCVLTILNVGLKLIHKVQTFEMFSVFYNEREQIFPLFYEMHLSQERDQW
jgi:hypothetical protein